MLCFPRSVMEESRDKFVQVNCQVNELVSSSEGFSNFQDGGSNILKIESKIQEENGSEANLLSKNRNIDGYGREKEMEKALEHQAQLIDQYEAMEKAQREWEDKFREHNSTTPVCMIHRDLLYSKCFSLKLGVWLLHL